MPCFSFLVLLFSLLVSGSRILNWFYEKSCYFPRLCNLFNLSCCPNVQIDRKHCSAKQNWRVFRYNMTVQWCQLLGWISIIFDASSVTKIFCMLSDGIHIASHTTWLMFSIVDVLMLISLKKMWPSTLTKATIMSSW